MNKKLKKTIAITLIVGAFTVIAPVTNINLMTTKAYADTSDGVTSLNVKSSSGSSLAIYDDNDYESNHKVSDDEIKDDQTYYAKTSSNSIKISISGVNSDYVRVFDGTSSTTKGERVGSTISLSETTTVVVRVYSTNPGSVKYNNKTNMISEYRIKVKYTGSNDDGEQSNVYLESIFLSSGDISFLKKTYTYDVNVAEDIDEVTIGARPDCNSSEYDDYKVRIAGTKVDQDDKFKDTVSLNKGKNSIEITVEDDRDNMKTYMLNITRGSSFTTTSSTLGTGTVTNEPTSNETKVAVDNNGKWININGVWKYNDSIGNAVKNSWVQNYYVQDDGSMATGWLNYDRNWYYLGIDGSKKTGWQLVNGLWYYLDSVEGKMQTGWIKDIDEKYYFLNNDGAWVGR